MRISTKCLYAKDCPLSVFVYDDENKEFFFADDVDIDDEVVYLFFEKNIGEGYSMTLGHYDKIYVVDNYRIDDEVFWAP